MSSRRGQVWVSNSNRIFLVLNDPKEDNFYYKLLNLETGRLDSASERFFDDPSVFHHARRIA